MSNRYDAATASMIDEIEDLITMSGMQFLKTLKRLASVLINPFYKNKLINTTHKRKNG
ncbi:hypothetical protein HRM2_14590 [Desulforapulum autotrophicum HRM2]|uniref:Uncharacterized protein n=1 Tax=Desulforapulum autotrophicum (strain ATCC 43914 / DSM 3382 / VKM B-1955 / HRM2) TaxID=177437 RepID=C0Q9K4_DESAH|nr:hypothetical protein HRM2_14590 [Desulforapulum autotrophicum HRM2]